MLLVPNLCVSPCDTLFSASLSSYPFFISFRVCSFSVWNFDSIIGWLFLMRCNWLRNFVEHIDGQCGQVRGAIHKRMTNRINWCNDSDSKAEIINNLLRWCFSLYYILSEQNVYEYEFDVVECGCYSFAQNNDINPIQFIHFITFSSHIPYLYFSVNTCKQFWNIFLQFSQNAFSLSLHCYWYCGLNCFGD